MSDSNVIQLAQPGAFSDCLTEVLRSGARALLTQAVEAEVAEFLAKHVDLKTETGQQRIVRHGHLPEREIITGIGPVAVRQPRVRDREATEGERIRYSPSILPPYARRSKSLEVLIPVLYLKGISTGDFEEALAALVGKSLPLRRQGTRPVYPRRPSPGSRACPRESGGRARVLEGARRGVADSPRAALLGAQDRQHPEQDAEEPAQQGQARAAGDLDGRDQEGCG